MRSGGVLKLMVASVFMEVGISVAVDVLIAVVYS